MDSSTPEIVVHDKSGVAGRNSPNGYDASHDRLGGLIVTWQQDRGNNLSADIYAQQIGIGGSLGINAQLIDEIDNVEIIEDEDFMIILGIHFLDVIRPFLNILPQLSDDQVTASISDDTLRINFPDDWNGDLAVDIIADWIGFPIPSDTTSFSLSVAPTQDAPTAFEWVSSAIDTINITKDNTEITYDLQWGESTDADGDTIDYLLYAQIGVYPAEEVYDTTSTSVQITYEEFLENVFEPFPMLSGVTVKFSVIATDGIDTVKVTGDDRVVYVNRYEYLSTEMEGIPTEFALHENYPNPFNPTTTLRFDLPEVSSINLTIYNMLGQRVRTFNMNDTPAGYHSIKWNATNDYGDPVGAGVYLYQLQTKDFVKTRKMVLLK
ncbi:MAG: T9SS type A sorting domain-containing protein [Candidatus Marinimicrobia bacterium]|nr:T9SS type A sorting domain-containing protein [Candidatus Neomarinimicrobiota bacterium]